VSGTRFRCVFANRAAESYLGFDTSALVGMPLDKLSQLEPQKLIEHFSTESDERSPISFEIAADRVEGESWLRIVVEPVGDDLSVTLIDITQRKRNEDKMLADALRDPLTGVLNRRGFEREGAARIRMSDQGAVLYLAQSIWPSSGVLFTARRCIGSPRRGRVRNRLAGRQRC